MYYVLSRSCQVGSDFEDCSQSIQVEHRDVDYSFVVLVLLGSDSVRGEP